MKFLLEVGWVIDGRTSNKWASLGQNSGTPQNGTALVVLTR